MRKPKVGADVAWTHATSMNPPGAGMALTLVGAGGGFFV
jgi:hypothetical protein